MQTRSTLDPLQPKTWQLDTPSSGQDGYLYYCLLCDEALVLSQKQISPQKIQLAMDNTCPGCGFELERVLSCKYSLLPQGRRLLTNLGCRHSEILLEQEEKSEDPLRRGSSLPRDFRPNLTTGIEAIDKKFVLRRGQLVYLQGDPSNQLSQLLCVRATLPPPEGLDTNVVFIDAGNLFDSYTISHHAINHGLDNESVQKRIHLSRAFTHHQVHNLITEKLPLALEEYPASLAVVSDITALFCDPDVRNKRESLEMFRRSIRFLSKTAENRDMLIVVTNLQTRNKTMEKALAQTAHVSAILKARGDSTQVTVTRHPFTPERQGEVNQEYRTLSGFLQ